MLPSPPTAHPVFASTKATACRPYAIGVVCRVQVAPPSSVRLSKSEVPPQLPPHTCHPPATQPVLASTKDSVEVRVVTSRGEVALRTRPHDCGRPSGTAIARIEDGSHTSDRPPRVCVDEGDGLQRIKWLAELQRPGGA